MAFILINSALPNITKCDEDKAKIMRAIKERLPNAVKVECSNCYSNLEEGMNRAKENCAKAHALQRNLGSQLTEEIGLLEVCKVDRRSFMDLMWKN